MIFIMQFSLTQFPFLTNKKSPKECCWNYLIVNGDESQPRSEYFFKYLLQGQGKSLPTSP